MRRPPPAVTDAALGAGTAAALLAVAAFGREPAAGPGAGSAAVTAGGLAALAGLTVAVRRRHPLPALLVADLVAVAWFAAGHPGLPAFLPAFVTLFALTAQRGWRWGLAGALTTGLCMALVALTITEAPDPNGEGILLVFAAGVAVHYRRQLLAAVAGRVAREAQAREEQVRRQAVEERLRLARDVHDVVGHALATISVQAGVAVHVFDRQPAQALEALTAIKRITDEGLLDIRSLVTALQAEDDTGQPHAPVAGLDRLAPLIEATRTAGPVVRYTVHGEPRPVPIAVDLAAYRIIQESLTNVIRHADARTVWLDIGYRPTCLSIRIRDDGSRPGGPGADGVAGDGAPPVDGHGIRGMRDRALALSGRLTARAGPDGFEVDCELPTVPPAPGPEPES